MVTSPTVRRPKPLVHCHRVSTTLQQHSITLSSPEPSSPSNSAPCSRSLRISEPTIASHRIQSHCSSYQSASRAAVRCSRHITLQCVLARARADCSLFARPSFSPQLVIAHRSRLTSCLFVRCHMSRHSFRLDRSLAVVANIVTVPSRQPHHRRPAAITRKQQQRHDAAARLSSSSSSSSSSQHPIVSSQTTHHHHLPQQNCFAQSSEPAASLAVLA